MEHNISVYYNGETYSTGISQEIRNFLGLSTDMNICKEEGVSKYPVKLFAEYEDLGDVKKLNIGAVFFDIDTFSFIDENIGSMEYNITSHEGDFDSNIKTFCYKNYETPFNTASKYEVAKYILEVTKTIPTVYDYVNSISGLITTAFSRRGSYSYRKNNVAFFNLLNFISTNIIEMEKLISSNNHEYLREMLDDEKAVLIKGKKLAQVIELPKFAIEYIKTNNLMSAINTIRAIASEYDGNSLKIIFDTFDKFVPYEKYDSKRHDWRYTAKEVKQKEFLENVYNLLGKNYKIVDLLNYLLKQRMYWNTELTFGFPYEEAKELVDYLSICEQYNLNAEKYPQNVFKQHNIVLKNIEVLKSSDKNKQAFSDAVNSYFKEDIEIDDFIFSAPQSIEDLVAEGEALHHCIGNYSDNIIQGISKIFYMRFKSSPNVSYVTIELNENNDLVEFEGDYNKVPTDDDTLDALKKFCKKMKPSKKAL